MASWGLLQGFGRGLSQSSELLARGMAEDREAERQRMREESIERRWKRQEAREDARNKVSDDRYAEQVESQAAAQTQAQNNWKKSYGLQERQLNETTAMRKITQIESNIAGIEAAQEKSEAKITDKYARLMSREGITKEEFTELNRQFTDEVKQNRDYYSGKLHQFRQSYGDKLKGTGYEYLLHVKPDAAADDTAGAADPATTQAVVNDLTGGGGSSSGRGDYVKNSVGVSNDSASAEPSAPKPGFMSGVGNGFSGFYNSSPAADFSGASPLDYIKHGVGSVVGGVAGLPGDVLQMVGKGLLPMYTALTSPVSSPSNITAPELAYAQQRLGGGKVPPPPIPGETPQQYAARTGIKR